MRDAKRYKPRKGVKNDFCLFILLLDGDELFVGVSNLDVKVFIDQLSTKGPLTGRSVIGLIRAVDLGTIHWEDARLYELAVVRDLQRTYGYKVFGARFSARFSRRKAFGAYYGIPDRYKNCQNKHKVLLDSPELFPAEPKGDIIRI